MGEDTKNNNVLDICTGLGYTAIEAYRKAAQVTTIELDPNVIEIVKWNPYSQDLFNGIAEGEIQLIFGDVAKVIKTLELDSFDIIIHEPPRLSFTG
ncbi:MAG: methyltransferase [Candidatus Heimdallarchaeota archaeon]|nr:methyltransferase [Candidatus Heimdallarchaeota archaeon]